MKTRKLSMALRTGLSCLFVGASAVSAAHGADMVLPIKGLPEALPEIQPLTWAGFTLYGIVDISGQYESHGVPLNGPVPGSGGIIVPQNRAGSLWVLAPNQGAQSVIGVKFQKEIFQGYSLLAKAETGFNPTTGQLSDGLGSLRINNGVPLAQQTMSGDSPRAGQLFQGELWLGTSTPYGNAYVGRLNTPGLEMVGKYDPAAGYGFSLLYYIGSFAGGGGTENIRVDQAVKYAYSYGPVHATGFFASPDTSVKTMWQVSAGIDYKNFSIDFLGGHASDGVSVPTSLSGPSFLGSPFLGAKIFDADTYGAFAKYTINLGPSDEKIARSITFSGGFVRLDYSNPADGGYGVGHTTIGGYELGPALSTNGSAATGILNYAFTGADRISTVSFLGFKYRHDPKWSFSAGYYLAAQNSFGFGVPNLPFYNGVIYSKVACSSSSFTNCSGKEQVSTVRADYLLNRNWDLYGGLTWSRVDGGLAFGYPQREMYTVTTGVMFVF